MDELLKQLQQGTITFNAFYRETEGEWRALATDRYKKLGHRLQGSADLDDVFQEMLISVSQSVKDFDEDRTGMTLKRFVVWRAYAAAKDFVNQQCGAYRGRTAEPPRAPVIASMVAATGKGNDLGHANAVHDIGLLQQLSAVDADQEWCADVRTRRAAVCKTLIDHVVMTNLLEVGGSLQDISEAIYKNESLRDELALASPGTTYGMVRRATLRFVDRAACIA